MSKTRQTAKSKSGPEKTTLKGWREIADFLGQTVAVAERWAKTGMPVQKEGRSISASKEELTRWLGSEAGEPVHVATEESDLSAELKRGLSYVQSERQPTNVKRKTPGKR
jgi:hypothetical protein